MPFLGVLCVGEGETPSQIKEEDNGINFLPPSSHCTYYPMSSQPVCTAFLTSSSDSVQRPPVGLWSH